MSSRPYFDANGIPAAAHDQCPDCGYQPGDELVTQAERSELASLRAKLAQAEEEVERLRVEADVCHGWVYCPMCGSCGVGGCCAYYCEFCKDRHDKKTQDGSPARDLGDLSVMQGGWKDKVAAAEALAAEAVAVLREVEWNGMEWDGEDWNRACPVCGNEIFMSGHIKDCRLAAVLSRARSGLGGEGGER